MQSLGLALIFIYEIFLAYDCLLYRSLHGRQSLVLQIRRSLLECEYTVR